MKISVYDKEIKDDIADSLIILIKSRKGLENVDDSLCEKKITEFLKQNSKTLSKLSSAEDFKSIERSKEIEAVVKYARSKLRPVYGLFIEQDISKIREMLKKDKEKVDVDGILSMHVSSKERLGFYDDFYRKIFDVTGKPESIIDIACGLNPFSFDHMGIEKDTEYTALELNKNDADMINDFFIIKGINGKALRYDIIKEPFWFKAEIAFAFKIFDIIDNRAAERIIKEIDVKWIAASFSTKTVSSKDMRFKRRAGFQKMLRRLGMKYQTIEFGNEIVYLIKKLI